MDISRHCGTVFIEAHTGPVDFAGIAAVSHYGDERLSEHGHLAVPEGSTPNVIAAGKRGRKESILAIQRRGLSGRREDCESAP